MALGAYSAVGIAHISAAVVAMGSGAAVLLARKGTRPHVRVGWVYVGSLLFVDVSAMAIRNLTGRFNFFHALAPAGASRWSSAASPRSTTGGA